MTELLEVGDCIEGGRYRLHSRFSHALVFAREADLSDAPGPAGLACLVEPGLAGPDNVVVRELDRIDAETLDISSQHVLLGGIALRIRRRFQSALRIGPLDASRLLVNLHVFEADLRALAPRASIVFLLGDENPAGAFDGELALRFRAAAQRLSSGNLVGSAAMLCGLGRGLTPSGDDFLAGFLLGLHAFELAAGIYLREERRRICSSAVTANVFSRALLCHAAEGRCIAPAKSLIETLFGGGVEEVTPATRKLVAVGASSGADLGVGVAWAIRLYAGKVGRPC